MIDLVYTIISYICTSRLYVAKYYITYVSSSSHFCRTIIIIIIGNWKAAGIVTYSAYSMIMYIMVTSYNCL